MALSMDNRSVTELLSDALHQFTKLIRTEIELAKTEIAGKASQAAMGIAFIAGGALVTIAALVLLLLALAMWLAELGLSDSVAHLIAGVLGIVISAGLAWTGMNRLKPANLVPERTMDQLEQDAAAVREQMK